MNEKKINKDFSISIKEYTIDSNINTSIKELPWNFFEKIVDLELKLNSGYNQKVFDELVYLLNIAIDFYKSNTHSKTIDYQNKLNSILNHPEVIKNRNPGLNDKIQKKTLLRRNTEHAAKNKRINIFEDSRKRMSRSSFSVSSLKGEIDEIIRKHLSNNNETAIINQEIEKQEISFKNKMKDMKKRHDSKSHQPINYYNSCNTSDLTEFNLSEGNFENSEGELIINPEKHQKLTPYLKQKNEIIKKIENFSENVFKSTIENDFEPYNKSIEFLYFERGRKLKEVENFYQNQIEEVKELIPEGASDNIMEPFTRIIDGLIDEKENELVVINDLYDKKIRDGLLLSSKNFGKHKLTEIIYETFKLNIYKDILNIVINNR